MAALLRNANCLLFVVITAVGSAILCEGFRWNGPCHVSVTESPGVVNKDIPCTTGTLDWREPGGILNLNYVNPQRRGIDSYFFFCLRGVFVGSVTDKTNGKDETLPIPPLDYPVCAPSVDGRVSLALTASSEPTFMSHLEYHVFMMEN